MDLWVHAYDLATALGEPVDLDDDPALAEAWRYLSPYLSRLVAGATGRADNGAMRIDVDSEPIVTGKPGALVLLLSGRGDPEYWRGRNGLTWSGPRAEALVRRMRLFG